MTSSAPSYRPAWPATSWPRHPASAWSTPGAENVLAADWLADLASVDLHANSDVALIGIGGQTAEVRFVEVQLRLQGPDAGDQVCLALRCRIRSWVEGAIRPRPRPGRFLDRFTVTFRRGAAMLAIEEWDAFDARFGTGGPA